jgi:hypothetical protein
MTETTERDGPHDDLTDENKRLSAELGPAGQAAAPPAPVALPTDDRELQARIRAILEPWAETPGADGDQLWDAVHAIKDLFDEIEGGVHEDLHAELAKAKDRERLQASHIDALLTAEVPDTVALAEKLRADLAAQADAEDSEHPIPTLHKAGYAVGVTRCIEIVESWRPVPAELTTARADLAK